MEELAENSVLEDLYHQRADRFQSMYIGIYGKPMESNLAEQKENEVENIIKQFVQNDREQEQIFDKLVEYEESIQEEFSFWIKEYYKFGVKDGVNLKREINKDL